MSETWLPVGPTRVPPERCSSASTSAAAPGVVTGTRHHDYGALPIVGGLLHCDHAYVRSAGRLADLSVA
jgi:hypothetical protein